ncbi:phosphohydrolase [Chryseobacterium sp. POL2]|uniref:phosphohydrolase n=1 Tax=Chryseobacterium sp. POL2 TaxID=2713414 RepID=UPI0013E13133|nr:phosphohydrolase [Chryseobacterium sp. POL2]QIG88371.1 phosphohydrolase [Chryseobacterium sp. POL2]
MADIQLLYKAIKIAQKAHKRQTDKYDAPYLGHVFRVMEAGKTIDEKIVGALHDVVEDHPQFSFEYLLEQGFPAYIVEAVECLTKRDNGDPELQENYDDFIKRIEKNPLAVKVKINDLKDNMDLRRFTRPIESKDLKRLNKYLTAYQYLTSTY